MPEKFCTCLRGAAPAYAKPALRRALVGRRRQGVSFLRQTTRGEKNSIRFDYLQGPATLAKQNDRNCKPLKIFLPDLNSNKLKPSLSFESYRLY